MIFRIWTQKNISSSRYFPQQTGHRVHLHRCHAQRHFATPQRCGAGEGGGIHSAAGVGSEAPGFLVGEVATDFNGFFVTFGCDIYVYKYVECRCYIICKYRWVLLEI